MKMNPLGRTGIMVSELCLGTMTYGTQTTEGEAHEQIGMALAGGVNFLDTAEMYPVNPIAKEHAGGSEAIIGNWLEKTGRRSEVVIATKHSGEGLIAVRGGEPISSKTIAATVEGSLKRLKTDYIDLYQFHWPNRGSYMFRKNWEYDPSGFDRAAILADMEDCLGALQREVERGTIRAFGLSNESAWGTAAWLRLAEAGKGPRVASIQNEYSLLCRMYDTDLAELSVLEDVGLLAFSPLATGLLTGKYQNGAVPEGSRKTLQPELGGRHTPRAYEAVAAYLEIAQRHGLDVVQMALAWCRSRPFMASAIFGATHNDQMDRILGSAALELSQEVLDEINATHKAHPMPY